MKFEIEYNVVGDGRRFLNYWDWRHGDDVVAEIRNGELFLRVRSDNEEEDGTERKVTWEKFLALVEEKSVQKL